MCIVYHIKLFFYSGWRTFRSSAKGEYEGTSEAVDAIRREMFSQPSGRMGDTINMQRDRMMVGRDMRAGFKKIVLANG